MNKKEKKIQELTPEELLINYQNSLKSLQMKSRMGQLVHTHQIKQLKKEIARLITKKNALSTHENK